ncbi:RNA-DNA + DNA-DNA helicase [Synechococcus phage S-H34]|uniref:RNA-DNA + DNA-DNA helicase n=1 Tax=Synechococcus phage S-H34 TaxID=2718942 RepID=A0A6G8R651_9CAUD|nr:RNA-DNA + DNA-DNA helicase [Synechococcus phage S-H34]QIN96887.1 RNA-DNA + DNA-DNA helicase [Synechococcus phage S-H34]
MADVIISKKNEIDLLLDCEPAILYELQEEFSFDVEGASFSPAYRKKYWDGKIRLISVTTQTCPAGMVYRLCKWLDRNGYTWEFKDNKFYGVPYEVDEKITKEGVQYFMKKIAPGLEPRDYQIETVFSSLKEYRKTIVSPTGSGKSMMIYAIARYLTAIGKRTLIVVPTKMLVEQMTKDFAEYGWETDENVHKIYQGHSLDTKAPVTVSTFQSIYGLPKKWFSQFDAVLGDECHNFKAKVLQGIMKKCPDAKWRYGFTGTLDGKQVNGLILEGHFGPVFKTTTSSELMDKGFLAKLNVEILTLKHNPKKFATYNDEIEYLGELQSRNRFIANLANSLDGNVLILFTRVDGHGVPLYDLISEKTDRPVHMIHGGIDINVREEVRTIAEKSDNNIILGSYGTMSTGVNIKRLHHVIFASPSKSRVRVLQSIGRGLRKGKGKEECVLYDIADDFREDRYGKENFTYKHLAERIKFYVDEDFTYRITTIPLSSSEGELPI